MPCFLFLETWDTAGTHKDLFYCFRCGQILVSSERVIFIIRVAFEPWEMFIFRRLSSGVIGSVFFIFLLYKNRNKLISLPSAPPPCFLASNCRTVALMLEGLWSPAFQPAAAGAMATGLSATASVAMSTTTAARWGLRRRPICTRPRPLPSTPVSAEQRS